MHDTSGVGIGLYLAREIITMQGGYVKVASEVGKGSVFFCFSFEREECLAVLFSSLLPKCH